MYARAFGHVHRFNIRGNVHISCAHTSKSLSINALISLLIVTVHSQSHNWHYKAPIYRPTVHKQIGIPIMFRGARMQDSKIIVAKSATHSIYSVIDVY